MKMYLRKQAKEEHPEATLFYKVIILQSHFSIFHDSISFPD